MSEPPFDPTASRTLWTIMGMTRPHDEVYTDPHIVACTQQILQHQDRTRPRYLVRNP